MKMSETEILELVIWRDSNEARLERFSPILEKNVEVHILTHSSGNVSDRSIQTVNDFINLAPQSIEIIANYLWEDCKLCCDVTSYGFDVPDGKSETEANHQEFGVFNGADALAKSNFMYLLISEDDQNDYTNNYAYLNFDNDWNGHITTIVMKNGEIVGWGDSGLYVGEYE